MKLQGYWFSEGSAERHAATLILDDDIFTLDTVAGQHISGNKASLIVGDRLGNVERKIKLEQGAIFATADNDLVDKLFKRETRLSRFIHQIESHIAWVVIALLVTLLSGYAFLTFGIPWSSKKIAHILPHETNVIIAKQSFNFLDKYVLDPSHLNEERQTDIRHHFEDKLLKVIPVGNEEIDFQLHFRQWNQSGIAIPNALALPSGDIILTDKFVELTENQQQIEAVLLHEIGHVVQRHSLQMLAQTTLVTTAIMMVTGDTSVFADMGIGLASLLVSNHYSRGHESEADLFAFQQMLKLKIDPKAFSDIMGKMARYSFDSKEKGQDNKEKDDSDWLDYFSTHPSTEQRILQGEQFSQCFQQGIESCELP